MEIKEIGVIKTDFKEKFGLPRQSGLVKSLKGEIRFFPPYNKEEAVRGLEGYDYIWVIWQFSKSKENGSITVRPPRLGGNKRIGVFATRSPFRPNGLGLSCLKLDGIRYTEKGEPVIAVSGIDMADDTPVYDIKPYLASCDLKEGARGGFAEDFFDYKLQVNIPENVGLGIPEELLGEIKEILAQDPRPSYQNDPERVYVFDYCGYKISFKVHDEVEVIGIVK